jgi:hypothetical protein
MNPTDVFKMESNGRFWERRTARVCNPERVSMICDCERKQLMKTSYLGAIFEGGNDLRSSQILAQKLGSLIVSRLFRLFSWHTKVVGVHRPGRKPHRKPTTQTPLTYALMLECAFLFPRPMGREKCALAGVGIAHGD